MPSKKKPVVKPGKTKKKKLTAHVDSRQSGDPIVASDASAGELEALRESEERFRLFQGILQSSSDGILAVNRENEVLFANQRFVEMWRIPKKIMAKKDDTLLLQYVLDQLTDPQGFLNKVQELYNSAEESKDTLKFKDGRVFDRRSRPLLQGMELRGRVWSFRDITEQKQVEEALAGERYLLRTVIDFSPYEIFMKDLECRYTLVNANQAKVLGLATPAEALGKTAFDFFPQELAALFHEDDLSIIQTGQPMFDAERPRKGRKGEEQWRLVSKVPFRDTNGNVTGVVGIGRDITENKRAEKALRESEERYRSLFERMMDGVYRSTHKGRFVDVNPAMVKMFGYSSKEEMLKVDIKKELYFAAEERGSHILDTGQEEMDVYRMRRKDGSEIWVEDHGFYIHDQQGNVLYHEGMLRDITDRKQIEDTLSASEAKLRALFASMHDVVLVIDREGIYRDIAPTNPGLLVRPPEELFGKNLSDVFPAQEAEFFCGVVQQVLETKQNTQIEYELVINGQALWFQTTISPLDADSTLWVAHDITERKRVEEALHQAEEKYRTIFENAVEGIFQSTPQGRFITVNPAFARMLGYESPEELISIVTDIASQIYMEAPGRAEFMQVMAEHGRVSAFEFQMRRKDGSGLWVSESAHAVRDDEGRILYYEGIAENITERKQVEESLTASEAELSALFAGMSEVIIIFDVDGHYVKIAPTNPTNLYRPAEEMLGKTLNEILPKEQADYILAKIRESIQSGQIVAGEYSLQSEGKEVWRSARFSPLSETTVIMVAHDITERRQAEEELRLAKYGLETANLELQQSLEREKLLASTDGLTGICNHRHLFELAAREFKAAVRYRRPLAFLMFDMDDFKQVNDTLGHTAGDQLLVRVAQAAVAQVRVIDVVARYGGDEFIILLPDASALQALPVAERIRANIAALHVGTDKTPFTITLSIGIAEMQHEPLDESVDRIIQRADQALYQAKESGRNRTVIFGQDETSAN